MIDTELQALAGQAPDRSLEGLEASIWTRLARRERAVRATRGLLCLQAAMLLVALAGSLVIGRELAQQRPPDTLAVLSEPLPFPALSASSKRP